MGAVAAGADAVYLGGDRFTARAYARNFTREALIKAIEYAHLRGVKIYLTLNTLVKEREYDDVREYIKPLHEAGLDAVIVQDIGVMNLITGEFEGLKVHASTQAAVTGIFASKMLKDRGVSRVVPARELSLAELKSIKESTGIEIEAFIHGAMCYSYSGMCLFSAMIGGRSGNRGRCGGACRLPYESRDKAGELSLPPYPLSLRDMCTLPYLKELILPEDGRPVIDSLKIEGRMKSADYTAGVTDVYRRAVDLIFEGPDKPYEASKHDLDILKGLYLRTDLCGGYFFLHNGSAMISGDQPGYLGGRDDIRGEVEAKFLQNKARIPVEACLKARIDEPLTLELRAAGEGVHGYSAGETIASVHGAVPEKARDNPTDRDVLKKQLDRFGGSDLDPVKIEIDTDGSVFVPASVLNSLRREACNEAVSAILDKYDRRRGEPAASVKPAVSIREAGETASRASVRAGETEGEGNGGLSRIILSVSVTTKEQLNVLGKLADIPDRVYVPLALFLDDSCADVIAEISGKSCIFASLPYIMREDAYLAKADIDRVIFGGRGVTVPEGVLARNLEELGYLRSRGYEKTVVSDLTIPVWNKAAINGLEGLAQSYTISPELNISEIKELCENWNEGGKVTGSVVLYGRVPMMISANCVRKTGGKCTGPGRPESHVTVLTDRKRNRLPVISDCRYCYNILLNAYPTDIMAHRDKLIKAGIREFRTALTCENSEEASAVFAGKPAGTGTSGRFIKGVE